MRPGLRAFAIAGFLLITVAVVGIGMAIHAPVALIVVITAVSGLGYAISIWRDKRVR